MTELTQVRVLVDSNKKTGFLLVAYLIFGFLLTACDETSQVESDDVAVSATFTLPHSQIETPSVGNSVGTPTNLSRSLTPTPTSVPSPLPTITITPQSVLTATPKPTSPVISTPTPTDTPTPTPTTICGSYPHVLLSPANPIDGSIINDNMPDLEWAVTPNPYNAEWYRKQSNNYSNRWQNTTHFIIQLDDNPEFIHPTINERIPATVHKYPVTMMLDDGHWYWRMWFYNQCVYAFSYATKKRAFTGNPWLKQYEPHSSYQEIVWSFQVDTDAR